MRPVHRVEDAEDDASGIFGLGSHDRNGIEVTPTAEDAPDPRAVVARRVIWTGCALFVAVDVLLIAWAGLAVVDATLLSLLLVGLPTLSLAQLPFLRDLPLERLAAYKSSIVHLCILGAASWLVGSRSTGAAAVGFVALSPFSLLTWSVLLTSAVMGVILLFMVVSRTTGVRDSPILRQLLPVTRHEKGVFALLSVAAGFGEEMAYRGYALPLLAAHIGVPAGIAVTSFVFGLAHAYQGVLGIFRTGVMGAVLAWGFLASGSLWPAIVAHIALDLLAGIVLRDRLLSPGEAVGVSSGSIDDSSLS